MSSCVFVCLSGVCVCLSVCVHDNSKNNGSIHLKLKHIVVYERVRHWALSDQGQGHGVTLKIFIHLPQYKVSSPVSQLWHMLGSCN